MTKSVIALVTVELHGLRWSELVALKADDLEAERSIADVREWLAFREGRERPSLWAPHARVQPDEPLDPGGKSSSDRAPSAG